MSEHAFRFIHTADLHLDSPLRGLDRYEGAPVEELRGATRRALERIVDLAIAERVAFVLIAGDVYDGDWRDFSTGLFFVRCMGRLRAEGIRVFIVSGNHDAASQISRHIQLPDNVTEFPTGRAASERFEVAGSAVVVHGRGFARRDVSEDLRATYPPPEPGAFHIGLLHTSADGREGHANYAPTTVEALRNHGYDYWALGHVHRREVLSDDPWIVFPGNPQGRHARETGAKGCSLVTVESGRVASVSHRETDVIRWAHLEVSVSDARSLGDIVDEAESTVLGAHGRGGRSTSCCAPSAHRANRPRRGAFVAGRVGRGRDPFALDARVSRVGVDRKDHVGRFAARRVAGGGRDAGWAPRVRRRDGRGAARGHASRGGAGPRRYSLPTPARSGHLVDRASAISGASSGATAGGSRAPRVALAGR